MTEDIFTGNWKNRSSIFSTAGADATICVFTFSVFMLTFCTEIHIKLPLLYVPRLDSEDAVNLKTYAQKLRYSFSVS